MYIYKSFAGCLWELRACHRVKPKRPTANDEKIAKTDNWNNGIYSATVKNLTSLSSNDVFNKSVTLKVIVKAIQNIFSCLPCFNWKY